MALSKEVRDKLSITPPCPGCGAGWIRRGLGTEIATGRRGYIVEYHWWSDCPEGAVGYSFTPDGWEHPDPNMREKLEA